MECWTESLTCRQEWINAINEKNKRVKILDVWLCRFHSSRIFLLPSTLYRRWCLVSSREKYGLFKQLTKELNTTTSSLLLLTFCNTKVTKPIIEKRKEKQAKNYSLDSLASYLACLHSDRRWKWGCSHSASIGKGTDLYIVLVSSLKVEVKYSTDVGTSVSLSFDY